MRINPARASVYVTVYDKSGASKHLTIYQRTVPQVVDLIRAAVERSESARHSARTARTATTAKAE